MDDHPLVREWLANLINQEPSTMVCGYPGSAREASHSVASTRPAIVIVDVHGHGLGLELLKDIKAMDPDVAAIVLSMHDEALYAAAGDSRRRPRLRNET